jgi:hypothetical protein
LRGFVLAAKKRGWSFMHARGMNWKPHFPQTNTVSGLLKMLGFIGYSPE